MPNCEGNGVVSWFKNCLASVQIRGRKSKSNIPGNEISKDEDANLPWLIVGVDRCGSV